jgi:hypothetical protein
MVNILNAFPTWTIMLAAAVLIVAANEVGFRFGRGKGPSASAQDPATVVQGAAFTVLALLLGFSFALALGRYDARRATLVREANAIGTTFLRTGLLDAKASAQMRAYLRMYVAERLEFAQTDAAPEQRRIADDRSNMTQRAMWRLAADAARRDSHSTTIPLVIAGLNDTINSSTEERAILTIHIPDIIILGLVLIALIASAMMGYGFGRQGQRAIIFKATFAIMLSIALGMILDLDRPQRGLIRVNLAPLQNTQSIIDANSV